MKRQVAMHSRSRVRKIQAEKRRGRHNGTGKRKGTRNARMPAKVLWMRRQRVLRRLLKKYREAKKITKDLYHQYYLAAKGNQFKNKNVLIEKIHKMKSERLREKQLKEQQDARRTKNAEKKAKRLSRKEATMGIQKKEEPVKAQKVPAKEASKDAKDAKEAKKAASAKPAKKAGGKK